MAESIFSEKVTIPNDDLLENALKISNALWDKMIEISGGRGEWKFYTKAAGWTYSIKKNQRTLFYMIPKDGWFKLTFVFGERAIEAAKLTNLPKQTLNALLTAKRYVEGRSITIKIESNADIPTAQKLLQLKLKY
jgi:hypothetical protein